MSLCSKVEVETTFWKNQHRINWRVKKVFKKILFFYILFFLSHHWHSYTLLLWRWSCALSGFLSANFKWLHAAFIRLPMKRTSASWHILRMRVFFILVQHGPLSSSGLICFTWSSYCIIHLPTRFRDVFTVTKYFRPNCTLSSSWAAASIVNNFLKVFKLLNT